MATAMMLNLMVIITLLIATAAAAYTNHTVGGDAGWFFSATNNTPATNYSSWASTETFNLGDYLIFRTNSNQTVIQTYNETTYKNCTTNDASNNDTSQYGGGNIQFGVLLTVAVPLTIAGPNYYFSDAGDGVQCLSGMAYAITVQRGSGLPPSLNQPPPPPYMEPPGPGSADSPPGTGAGGTESQGNGGLRSGANVRVVSCVVLLVLILFLTASERM